MLFDSIVDMAIPDSEIHSVIFELTKSMAGHSDLETLCHSLAASLRRVVSFDDLGLILHDPIRNELRLHAISTNRPFPQNGKVVSPDDDPVAISVWRNQTPWCCHRSKAKREQKRPSECYWTQGSVR